MVKATDAGMDTHLALELTKLASAWLIERLDGSFFRFTTNTRDVDIDIGDGNGLQTYSANEGYTRTNIANDSELNVGNLDIGVPLFKRYTFATAAPHDRLLTKIVTASYRFYLEGVLQVETTDFTIDIDTGLLTMVVAPASTGGSGPSSEEILTGRWEFDAHARLDIDDLKINMEMFNAGSWPNIPIVELLGTGL